MTKKKDDAQKVQKPTPEGTKKQGKGAQEVQDATPAPDVLELTRKAMQRDIRNLAGFADALDKPGAEQEAAYYAYLVEHAQEVQDATDKEQLTFTLPEVAPELNPDSPQFDIEAYKKAIEEAGGFPVLADYLDKTLRDDYGETMQKLAAAGGQAAAAALAGSEERLKEIGNLAANAAARALAMNPKGIAAALAARHAGLQAAFEAYKETAEEAQKAFEESREHREAAARGQWPEFDDAPDHIQIFTCFLVGDFEAAEAEGLDLEGLNVAQIMQEGFTSEWEPIKESPYFELIERVEDRALNAEAARRFLEEIRKETDSATAGELKEFFAKETEKVLYPVDKSNSLALWNPAAWGRAQENAKNDGQLTFDIYLKEKGNPPAAHFVYSFADLPFPKSFDQFDKRVNVACGALYNEIGPDMTIRQIYKTMTGSDTNPDANTRKKIKNSLLKQRGAGVDVNCEEELKAFKEEYEKRGIEIKNPVYNDALLSWSSFRGKVNGKETEIIHLKSEPILINFARIRGQITTVDRKLLEPPAGTNLTARVMTIQDYLIYQIALKAGGRKKKLSYKTIEKHCNITGRDAKKKAPATVKTLLQDFKIKGFIESWKEYKEHGEPEGVEIIRNATNNVQ